jgi:hypothetical protein
VLRTSNNDALLSCLINLEDIILFVVSLLERKGEFLTISANAFLYGVCELNTLNVIGGNLPFKIHCVD